MVSKSESAKMLCSADRTAGEFVARFAETYCTAPFEVTSFFCLTPVRATVISQAKLSALASFEMRKNPTKNCRMFHKYSSMKAVFSVHSTDLLL